MPRRGSGAERDAVAAAEARRLARKARRHADRRAAILAAARTLLDRAGIEALTIAAVAEAAEVSKPAVYYYFRSREEVLGHLAADLLEGEVEAILAAIDRAPSGVEALAALVRTKVDRYARDLDAFRVAYVYPQLVRLPPALVRERVLPLSWRVNDVLEARLRADRAAGRLAPGLHPRRLANLAWIAAHGILSLAAAMEAAGSSTAASVRQLRDEAVALVRRAAVEGGKGRVRAG